MRAGSDRARKTRFSSTARGKRVKAPMDAALKGKDADMTKLARVVTLKNQVKG